jgi:phosphoribosylformylglycinamidine synthase
MLAVVEPEKLDQVLAACERWQTGAAAIGEVTAEQRIRIRKGDEVVGDMPVDALVDGCPLYDLEPEEPAGWMYGNADAMDTGEAGQTLLTLLHSPSIASKRWAFEQYDSIVQSRTVKRPEAADAAVLRLEGGGAIAISIDGNGRRVACDPYQGTVEAVLECAANLACVGAEPLGVTNCLNFGNPEKPHVAWQLDRSTQGLADACRELGVPVVGGNVSLYNETEAGPIYPTPVIGMVGELPDPAAVPGIALGEGDAVALVGPFAPSLAGSELAKLRGELGPGLSDVPPDIVRAAIELVRELVRAGRVRCVHDVSDGGLACALAECAIAGGVGVRADLGRMAGMRGAPGAAALFGEGPGGFVLGGERDAIEELAGALGDAGAIVLGEAGGRRLELSAGEQEIALDLADLERAWSSLGERLAGASG